MFYDICNYNLKHSLDQGVKSHHMSGQILKPATEQSNCTFKKGLRLCFSLSLSAQTFCIGNGESGAGVEQDASDARAGTVLFSELWYKCSLVLARL